jgi:hypothetical protein
MLANRVKWNDGTIEGSQQDDRHCQWGTDRGGSCRAGVGDPARDAVWRLVSEGAAGRGWNHSFSLQASPDTVDPICPADCMERAGQRRHRDLFPIAKAAGRVADNARVVPDFWKTCASPRQRYSYGFRERRSPENLPAPASSEAPERGGRSKITGTSNRSVRATGFGCDFRVYLKPRAR